MPGTKDNKNALKHGGEATVKAITKGEPLRGLAAEAQADVMAEYETSGHVPLVLKNASRLQAAANLYWAALSNAAEAGDLEKIDRYIQRLGWLTSCALRAWAEVRKDTPDKPKKTVIDMLSGGDDGN